MRAEVADHGAQRSRNEHADPVAEVRFGSKLGRPACAIGKSAALLPSTDMGRLLRHVRFVPIGDVTAATRQGYQPKDWRRDLLRPPSS